MVVSFWSSLSSRAAFFVPRTAWNPCITPLNVMADVRRWFRRLVTFSQSTSTSTIPLKYLLTPFVIRTTVCHMISFSIVPSRNAAWMMATTFSKLVKSGVLYQVAEINHWRSCSALIPDRSPGWLRKILRITKVISLFSSMESSTGKGCTLTGIGCPGGGTVIIIWRRYSKLLLLIMMGIHNQKEYSWLKKCYSIVSVMIIHHNTIRVMYIYLYL